MAKHKRHPEAQLYLARIALFGFRPADSNREVGELDREGRRSTVTLSRPLSCKADDPRDRWLLAQALDLHARFFAHATYFAQRPSDGAWLPVEISLERSAERFSLRHAVCGRESQPTHVDTPDDLLDALPFLAPPNAVGYHRARWQIVCAYSRLRPKAWADVSIVDPGMIVEYERHRVTPADVARAVESGIIGMDRIITAFGIPADEEWERLKPTQ